MDALLRGRVGPRQHAPGNGGDGRALRRGDSKGATRMPRDRRSAASAVADDRSPVAEGLGRSEGGRRPPRRGLLAGAPGSAAGSEEEPRAVADARGVDARAETRGALRRRRQADPGAEGARARGPATDERQSPRQRWNPEESPAAAVVP